MWGYLFYKLDTSPKHPLHKYKIQKDKTLSREEYLKVMKKVAFEQVSCCFHVAENAPMKRLIASWQHGDTS